MTLRFDANTKGVFTIFTTPFTPDGSLDLNGVGQMVDFYRDKGCVGITLLGVMGEAPKLSSSETRALVKEVIREAPDMPVVVGISATGLAQVHEMSQDVMDLGAAGVMVNGACQPIKTDGQCLAFFEGVAEGLGDIPWCLQDFPLATGVVIPPHILETVFRNHANCVMLKQEDWPGWHKLDHLRGLEASGDLRRISILTGFGGLYLPEDLIRGSDGAMIGFSYPEMLVQVCAAHAQGDLERMYDIFDAYLPLVRTEMSLSKGLTIRKYILHKRGALPHDTIRKPGAAISRADAAQIDRLMARLDRRLAELG